MLRKRYIYTVLLVVVWGAGGLVCFIFKFSFTFVFILRKSLNLYFRNMETRSVE